jgi:plasmid stabilization system protein ParE
MRFQVRLTREAREDVRELFDFLLHRELSRPGGGDLSLADKAIAALESGFATLQSSPFTCRKASSNPLLRELIVPFGATGYVALFEINDAQTVIVAAVRHQRESDYH